MFQLFVTLRVFLVREDVKEIFNLHFWTKQACLLNSSLNYSASTASPLVNDQHSIRQNYGYLFYRVSSGVKPAISFTESVATSGCAYLHVVYIMSAFPSRGTLRNRLMKRAWPHVNLSIFIQRARARIHAYRCLTHKMARSRFENWGKSARI